MRMVPAKSVALFGGAFACLLRTTTLLAQDRTPSTPVPESIPAHHDGTCSEAMKEALCIYPR